MDLKPYINRLRDQITESLLRDEFGLKQMMISDIDEYLCKPLTSDLEKAFFLVLNQFPGEHTDYIIVPSEMVLIQDVYDMSVPLIEYEIDFAIYGGSLKDPVKVAIEIDGQRSHGEKHVKKDRRKDTNLQAAGWLVMRFSSKEIHTEIQRFDENPDHVSDFLVSIDHVIRQKLNLITGNNYARADVRSLLTGYTWGAIDCPNCQKPNYTILNKRKQSCRHCGEKFIHIPKPDLFIKGEYNGLYYF